MLVTATATASTQRQKGEKERERARACLALLLPRPLSGHKGGKRERERLAWGSVTLPFGYKSKRPPRIRLIPTRPRLSEHCALDTVNAFITRLRLAMAAAKSDTEVTMLQAVESMKTGELAFYQVKIK